MNRSQIHRLIVTSPSLVEYGLFGNRSMNPEASHFKDLFVGHLSHCDMPLGSCPSADLCYGTDASDDLKNNNLKVN